MKKAFFALIFCCVTNSFALAEENHLETPSTSMKARTGAITLNPLGILFNQIGGKLAFKISRNVAITVPFIFHYWGFWLDSNSYPLTWGGSVGVGAKIYLSDEAFKSGWFIEPSVKLGYSRLFQLGDSLFVAPGILGGYGWVWDSGFSLNLGVGLSTAVHALVVGQYGGVSVYPWPDFELALGYSW